jgi:C4-dicarboxylate-binding protein DctP
VLLASACGTPPARSGELADPVSLSSVDPTGAGGVGGDVLDQLVKVSAGGAVHVEAPVLQPMGGHAEDDALDALRTGRADLAVLRADTLASAGASSLSALQLPLLIESTAHADRIATDPIAAELMADLDALGLVGVALVPGGLRHPFGYVAPLLGPEDYAGAVINTRPGAGVDRLLGALGATTDHSVDAARDQAARSGRLRGIEVSLQQPQAVTLPAVVTSNVTLYTKFDVVAVRKQVWQRLTDGQRQELQRIAREAGVAATAGRDSEGAGLTRFCDSTGGSSVVADAPTVEALRAALQPVVEEAVRTPAIARLVDRIRALGDGTSPPPGRECGRPVIAGEESAATTALPADLAVTPRGPQDVLEGVWRVEADRQAMIDAGVSPQAAGANAGVWTITITGNRADIEQPHGPNCTWEFHFDGDRVALDQAVDGNDACGGLGVGTYEIDGDVVRFHFDWQRDYDVALDNSMFAGGMHRVG